MSARVDSAPWLRLGPCACRPSYPPPVCSSYIGVPASFSVLSPTGPTAPIAVPATGTTGQDGKAASVVVLPSGEASAEVEVAVAGSLFECDLPSCSCVPVVQ